MKKKDEQTSDFPKISAPAIRALNGAGYTRLEQLTKVTEAELMALHGFGKHGLEILRKAMAEKGLSFAEGTSKKRKG